MTTKLNNVFNEIATDIAKDIKDEKRYKNKIEKEAKEGKRNYIIMKDGCGSLLFYIEGDKTSEYIMHRWTNEIKSKYLKVLSKEEADKILFLRRKQTILNRKYRALLEKTFKSKTNVLETFRSQENTKGSQDPSSISIDPTNEYQCQSCGEIYDDEERAKDCPACNEKERKD